LKASKCTFKLEMKKCWDSFSPAHSQHNAEHISQMEHCINFHSIRKPNMGSDINSKSRNPPILEVKTGTFLFKTDLGQVLVQAKVRFFFQSPESAMAATTTSDKKQESRAVLFAKDFVAGTGMLLECSKRRNMSSASFSALFLVASAIVTSFYIV
jgi:hypothetical protein